jgi:hypothetical protein
MLRLYVLLLGGDRGRFSNPRGNMMSQLSRETLWPTTKDLRRYLRTFATGYSHCRLRGDERPIDFDSHVYEVLITWGLISFWNLLVLLAYKCLLKTSFPEYTVLNPRNLCIFTFLISMLQLESRRRKNDHFRKEARGSLPFLHMVTSPTFILRGAWSVGVL